MNHFELLFTDFANVNPRTNSGRRDFDVMNQPPSFNGPSMGSNTGFHAPTTNSPQFLLSFQNLEFVKGSHSEIEGLLRSLRTHTRVLATEVLQSPLIHSPNNQEPEHTRARVEIAKRFRRSEDVMRFEYNIPNDSQLRNIIKNGLLSFLENPRESENHLGDGLRMTRAVEMLMAYGCLWQAEDNLEEELRRFDQLAELHLLSQPLPPIPIIEIIVTGPDEATAD